MHIYVSRKDGYLQRCSEIMATTMPLPNHSRNPESKFPMKDGGSSQV